MDAIKEYLTYVNKTGSRRDLYKLIKEEFNIKSAIYPGSYIDIDPSIYIEKVTYIDNFKKANTFFKNKDDIFQYIKNNKTYNAEATIDFIFEDYSKAQNIEKVDLIISQYAGFVAQQTKQFLKKDGILLCNDSHGDATLAYLDSDFKLIAVINENKIIYENLDKYFTLSKNREIDISIVKSKMKGFKYINNPQNYIFKKIK